MAFPAVLRRLVIALNGVDGPEYYQAGVATLKPGMVCMFDDADEVKLCTSTGQPAGIIGCDADHDLATVYALGERIPVWAIGCGVDIYVRFLDKDHDQTIELGKTIITADETTQIGNAMLFAFVAVTSNFLDATGRAMTSMQWIGKALASGTVTSNTVRYVPVKLT